MADAAGGAGMAKVLLFDIETTDLSADFGTLLVFGWKWLGARQVHTFHLGNQKGWSWDDRALVTRAHKVLMSADMLVSHYGKGFDLPFLNAKFLAQNLPVLPNIPHVDTYWIARHNLALKSRRLASLEDYFWPGKAMKTPLQPSVWRRAASGDRRALRYIIEHCHKDVLVLEKVYLRLRPLVRTHPRVCPSRPEACRVCGGPVQSRGYAVTVASGPKRRVQCQSCGAWEARALTKAEKQQWCATHQT